jgi:hypothetical protein
VRGQSGNWLFYLDFCEAHRLPRMMRFVPQRILQVAQCQATSWHVCPDRRFRPISAGSESSAAGAFLMLVDTDVINDKHYRIIQYLELEIFRP